MKLDISNSFIKEDEIIKFKDEVLNIYNNFKNNSNNSDSFLGWSILPDTYSKEEINRIKECANRIRNNSKVFIVIGIGGSFLGAKSVIDCFMPYFNHPNDIEVLYVGNNLSGEYISDLLKYVQDKDYTINVVSKSGTTTEPAIAFRIFKDDLEKRYGKEEARKRIIVDTDSAKGTLRHIADVEGYESFDIPSNIGGRYSVLTVVGLLPIAVAGINIDKILDGAKKSKKMYFNENTDNDCYKYAVTRYLEYKNGKSIELFVNYEPKLHYFGEWLKQLFGESEGKDGKGIFPASLDCSTDLHSLGQYIQEGQRIMFETVISINKSKEDVIIQHSDDNFDNLNYLEGKNVDYVNKMAMQGVVKAHVDGSVPNIMVEIPEMSEEYIGKLIYFFELACGLYCELLKVNPFNQPGVEKYKNNMYELLGKPGYEKK